MRSVLSVMALLLAGCGSGNDDEQTIGDEIAEDYNRAMDGAQAVEEQLREQQERVERVIEDPE